MQAEATERMGVTEEDALRAHIYHLLARLFAEPPTTELMEIVRGLEGDQTPFGQALGVLSAAARKISVEAAGDEFFDLFVGAGRSELLPYGSYYITGFLNEWPAAKLVGDMRKLGMARADHVSEPEDHIAALCEMMAGMITGDLGALDGIAADLVAQRAFFDTHIGIWAPKFFEDLEASKTAAFYMPVGTIGKLFMEIEAEGFRMTA